MLCYRLVYYSRNRIAGTAEDKEAALAALLLQSRVNNERAGITGVLLFTAQSFAQVLEGPKEAVDWTFARIRFDRRHSDVVLLETAYQTRRHFAQWSMSFVSGERVAGLRAFPAGPDGMARQPDHLAGEIVDELHNLVSAPTFTPVL